MEGHEMEMLGFALSFVAMASLVALVFLGGSGSKMTSFKRTFSRRRSKKYSNNTERRDMGDEWEWPSHSRHRHHSRQPQIESKGQQVSGNPSNQVSTEKKSFVKRTPPLIGRWPHKRNPIKQEDFLGCYQRMALADPNEFKTEFESLPKEDASRSIIANTESNKKKNRFKNILPYDDCRVKLRSSLDGSDYINASYMQGVIRGKVDDKVFIATQGPLEHTIPDFWQMIWEQSSPVIVMLTNPIEKRKVKCSQYWPDNNQSIDVKVMQLACLEEKVEPFYIIRKINITKGNESRIIVQYQFTSWDDKAILETAMPIWQVLDDIGNQLQRTNLHGSLTVHCSAGIGRTGTFIALSILRSLLFHSGVVDVFNVVYDMRTRRMNMVQMKEQYQFIYESLVIWYLLKKTAFHVQRFRRDMKDWWRNVKNSQRKRAEDEYKLLGFICPPVRHRETRHGELKENYHKNRFPDLIPLDIHRPTLMTKPPYDPDPTNYINACFHHSFQKKNAFIATQSPLNETVGAFWSMVLDYNVASIVELTDTGHDAAVYCPEVGYELNYGQFMVICNSSNESNKRVTQRRLAFISNRKGRREMKQFIVDGRQNSDDLAESITAVVSSVQEWQRETGNGPIVVHCRNGIGLSGSFMAIYSAFDRLNAQHTIDVFTTVRRLRETRPEVVDSLEKYMMIYEALNTYLIHTEQSYSNFHEF